MRVSGQSIAARIGRSRLSGDLNPRIMAWGLIASLVLCMSFFWPYLVWPPHHHMGGEVWGGAVAIWGVRAFEVALVWFVINRIRYYGRRM